MLTWRWRRVDEAKGTGGMQPGHWLESGGEVRDEGSRACGAVLPTNEAWRIVGGSLGGTRIGAAPRQWGALILCLEIGGGRGRVRRQPVHSTARALKGPTRPSIDKAIGSPTMDSPSDCGGSSSMAQEASQGGPFPAIKVGRSGLTKTVANPPHFATWLERFASGAGRGPVRRALRTKCRPLEVAG